MDASDIALSLKKVSKDFVLPHEKQNSLKERVLSFKKPTYEKLHVLKGIDVEIKKGEFFGIVGRNGSGKSTLLKIIGGIYQPTAGEVKVNGTLTPFIELGIGFNPDLTGRENVFLNGAILGLSRKEVKQKYDEIVNFAELEKFMDQKLKNYSSGMQVRLAFSIAIQAHNDILLIDEVLAVGDSNFQKKCFDVFKRIKKEGKTVVFVTHDMGAVQDFCDRAMLINDGNIVTIGKSGEVAHDYNELNIQKAKRQTGLPQNRDKNIFRPVEVSGISTEHDGKKTSLFRPNQYIDIVVEYTAHEDVTNSIMGITIKDLTGRPIIVTNTKAKHIKTGTLKKDEKRRAIFRIENILSDGSYSVSPAVASEDAKISYDWIEEAWLFDVAGWNFPAALVQPKHTITVETIRERKA